MGGFEEWMAYLERNARPLREVPPDMPDLPRQNLPPEHIPNYQWWCTYCPVLDYEGPVLWDRNPENKSHIGWCRQCGQRYETVERA